MKNLFAVLILVLFSFASKAQTEKSTWLLGGNVGFTSQSVSGGGSASVFNLSPNAGYFFKNNYAVGGMVDLTSGGGATSWSIAPFIKGYFGKQTTGKPFAQVGLGFGGASGGGSTTAFMARGGYALFLNKNIAAEFAANFTAQSGVTIFGLGAGFQIHFKK